MRSLMLIFPMFGSSIHIVIFETVLLVCLILLSVIIYILYSKIKKRFLDLRADNKIQSKHPLIVDNEDQNSAWDVKRSPNRDKEMLYLSIYKDLSKLMDEDKIYHNPRLTRDDVVNRLGTSRRVFMEALQNHVNMSFIEYINTYRLNEAISLLENQDFTNETIAEEVGFGSANTFYRQFRTKYGLSPYEYKKNLNEAFIKNQSYELGI